MTESGNRSTKCLTVRAIVRTVALIGTHPRPVTERYLPRPGETVQWWEIRGCGWTGVRRAALAAGLAPANAITKDLACAWEWREEECGESCREIDDVRIKADRRFQNPYLHLDGPMTATERIAAIGKPRASVAAHQHYVPVADPKPRGPEGAARRLARTGLPASVTADVAQDIYRMFADGMTGHERGAHLKFWEWALRGMGAWPVMAIEAAR